MGHCPTSEINCLWEQLVRGNYESDNTHYIIDVRGQDEQLIDCRWTYRGTLGYKTLPKAPSEPSRYEFRRTTARRIVLEEQLVRAGLRRKKPKRSKGDLARWTIEVDFYDVKPQERL